MTDPIRAALSADGPAVPEGREPASVVGEPSDVDVLRVAAHALGYLSTPSWDFEAVPMSADDVLTIARAVLARWGHQPAPPAEGEVGELVRRLRSRAGILASPDFPAVAAMLTRAADLLAQRHPAPVPVAERLQQMEDLAADAVSALRYIEQSHGRLYGIGWDRVYEKADQLRPATAPAQPATPAEGEVQP